MHAQTGSTLRIVDIIPPPHFVEKPFRYYANIYSHFLDPDIKTNVLTRKADSGKLVYGDIRKIDGSKFTVYAVTC